MNGTVDLDGAEEDMEDGEEVADGEEEDGEEEDMEDMEDGDDSIKTYYCCHFLFLSIFFNTRSNSKTLIGFEKNEY